MNFRPATLKDSDLLYKWRTEGEQASWYEGPHTSRDQHEVWLFDRILSVAVRIWIVEEEETPIGVVRLDSNDEISVEIDPEWRGQGYGTKAIMWACQHATGRVKACVDATNVEARMAFEKAGFEARPDVIFYLYRP